MQELTRFEVTNTSIHILIRTIGQGSKIFLQDLVTVTYWADVHAQDNTPGCDGSWIKIGGASDSITIKRHKFCGVGIAVGEVLNLGLLGRMFYLVKALVFLITLHTSFVLGGIPYKCRQCHGTQTIEFKEEVTTQQALDFLKRSANDCATGKDFGIENIEHKGKTWIFTLKIWRYCGTGPSNFVSRGAHCYGNICSIIDKRALTCNKTVNCADYCDFKWCGV